MSDASETWAHWVRSGAWLSSDGRTLPLLPGFMRDALALGLDPNVRPHDLITRISAEQQLAARVLQLANLAGTAPLRPVTSIDEAVVRLGTRAVQRALMAACIESWAQPNVYGKEGVPQMHHALGAACMASLVAEVAGADPDEAFAYGLLHDIGKLFLLKSRAEFRRRGGPPPSREELDETITEWHAEIGDLMMELWGLPKALREPIRFHHSPADAVAFRTETNIAYAANRFAHRYGFGCDATPDDALHDDEIMAPLNVTESWIAELDMKARPIFDAIRRGLRH